MKALALLIGNGNYLQVENSLKNPANDARDFGEKLKKLGYIVRTFTNVDQQTMDTEVARFGDDLDRYDIGLFYFAGHGMQINGDNFITGINTNFDSEISAKFSSIVLNKVLAYMEKGKNESNVLILDACRNNPFERSWNRSVSTQGLAPMYAPKGTLIAFATSPGEKAGDGTGNNGLYTSALLKHIDDSNITIEEFFKRVRNSVYAFSNGKQTSWEHTSLTGTFIFNSGQLNHSANSLYHSDAIADKNYQLTNSDVSSIIKELKSSNWYKQKPAMLALDSVTIDLANINEQFVLGRNITQTANGGENHATYFMNHLAQYADKYNIGGQNHVLNGILFEVYFDSNGIIRDKIKDGNLQSICRLAGNPDFAHSFDFIEEQLLPFREDLFYIPSSKNPTVNLDLIFDKSSDKGNIIYTLKDVEFEGKSVLKKDSRYDHFSSSHDTYYEPLLYYTLQSKLSALAGIPNDKLKITSAFDGEIDHNSKIMFPIGYLLSR